MATATAHTALEAFLPLHEQSTRQRVIVWATPEQARAAIWQADLLATPLARALTSAAMWPERAGAWLHHEAPPEARPRSARLGDMLADDSLWTLLSEEPVALGLLWTPPAGAIQRPAEQFAAFDEPGFVKVVWTLEVVPFGAGHALLTTETGTQATDSRARDSPPVDDAIAWLLDGDPAIRWQTLRDLTDAAPEQVVAERAQVATGGWGARLLALQDPEGTWGRALYSPKWTSTTYTLLLLHWLGLPPEHPQARQGCRRLWEGARFYGGGLTLAKTVREPETCITGMLVLLACAFDPGETRLPETVRWLLTQQLQDGGWNCETVRSGSVHGSFHTSITVLEALDAFSRIPAVGTLSEPVERAATRGREFLLAHRLYRSHRTGEIADPALTRWRFPPQWHYDVLRALDHFRATSAEWDPRLGDALELVRRARRPDGRWPHRSPYAGRMWFALESAGPSRWNTLRALRVLRRYGASARAAVV